LDSIDASTVRTDFFGHAYIRDNTSIITDLNDLITHTRPPRTDHASDQHNSHRTILELQMPVTRPNQDTLQCRRSCCYAHPFGITSDTRSPRKRGLTSNALPRIWHRILTPDELEEPPVITFFSDLQKKRKPSSVTLEAGVLTDENIARSAVLTAGGTAVPFKPIGLGLPLSVRISQAYTGKYKTGLFGGSKDMLITSAVKSITTFDAKPRAINFLLPSVPRKKHLDRPPAGSDGTPYVFYSPALLERSLTMDLTMCSTHFPPRSFQRSVMCSRRLLEFPFFSRRACISSR